EPDRGAGAGSARRSRSGSPLPRHSQGCPLEGDIMMIKPRLETFEYDGVRLLPSRFKDQVDRACEVYRAIPNDDILKGFRRNAGLPAPGNGMRGWCTETSSVIFGQLLSGMARMSRATGDRALRDKALALLDGWTETLDRNHGDLRMRPYGFEKLVCGLVDLHLYADLLS